MLKILNVHGAGLHDDDTSWTESWADTISEGIKPEAVEQDFLLYDDVFGSHEAELDVEAVARAIGLLVTSGLVYGIGDLVRRNPGTPTARAHLIREMPDRLRWIAGMIVQWAERPALRKETRARLAERIRTFKPDVIVAHSLGSLVAYDTLVTTPKLGARRTLVTLGSQIGNAFVRGTFGGRLVFPEGLDHWYHLFNPMDDVFTARVRLPDASRFDEVDTAFDLEGFGDHEAVAYLRHENARYAVWQALHAARPAASRRVLREVTKKPDRRALLIGIDRYPDPSQRLEGCVNDVYQVSATLQECGFQPEEIRVVTDERATAEGIQERLEWLLVGAKPGDWRFLYYSGHGTQLPGYGDTEEVDRLDETLVPFDFDWSPATAITDNQMYELYSQLPYETEFMAVFDCCHSGGLARAGARTVRGVNPPDDVRHRALRWDAGREMWVPRTLQTPENLREFMGPGQATGKFGRAADLRRLSDEAYDATRGRLGHLGPYMPLVLQACREEEFSYEYSHGVTTYGAFTYAFTSTLRRFRHQGRVPTFLELVGEVGRTLAALGYDQHPQIAGPTVRMSARVPFETSTSRSARDELAEIVSVDLETAPDLEDRVGRLLDLGTREPHVLEPLPVSAAMRAADDRGDMRRTFSGRWGIDWEKGVQKPATARDLLAIVREARTKGESVRVVGAARSLSEVSNPSKLSNRAVIPVSLLELSDAIPLEHRAGSPWHRPATSAHWAALNPGKALYRCGSGRSVRRVLDDVRKADRSLANHGSGSFQGIVGALATGTHGSGAALPPLAGLVRALTVAVPTPGGGAHLELILPSDPDRKVFALADGAVIDMDDDGKTVKVTVRADDDVFDAHTVGLGCLGLVHSVVLEVIDRVVFLDERRRLTTWNTVRDEVADKALQHRHFEVQICPHAGFGAADGHGVAVGDHLVQLVERDVSGSSVQKGSRGTPLRLGRLDLARGLIGGRIRSALQDPTKLPNGIVCSLMQTAGPECDYTDYIAEVLLLELKYEGLGAEYAVPLSSAVEAADRILALARAHDDAAKLVMAGGGAHAKLKALWKKTPPLTAVVTMRFTAPDRALLSPSCGLDEPCCIFEIGMLGSPALEDALRDPTPEPDAQLVALYKAYDEGRRTLFRTLDKTLAGLGARRHWGLVNETTAATARAKWSGTWDTWKQRYDAVNLGGVFDNKYTDQLGISTR